MKTLKDIFDKAKLTGLTPEEKAAGLQALLRVMKDERQYQQKASSFLSIFTINRRLTFSMPILLIAVLLTGGVAAGARGALPGDVLYPVKVSINEEIQGALTFSAEGKAQWQAERAIRRLEEAEKLEAEGKLSAQAKADLRARFNEQAEDANDRLVELSLKNKNEAVVESASEFAANLRAHEAVIAKLAERGNEQAAAAVTAAVRMDAEVQERNEDRADDREEDKAIINVAPVLRSVEKIQAESEVKIKLSF